MFCQLNQNIGSTNNIHYDTIKNENSFVAENKKCCSVRCCIYTGICCVITTAIALLATFLLLKLY